MAFSVVSGCADKSGDCVVSKTKVKVARKAARSVLNPEIASTNAIALVNGVAITRADYDNWISIRRRVFCLNQRLDEDKKSKAEQYIRSTREVAFSDLIRRELIRQECEKRGLVPPERAVKVAQRGFMKGINDSRGSFEKFCGSLPSGECEMLRRHVFVDAQGEYLLGQWATNDLECVSDAEVSNRLEFVRNYQADVEKSNAEAKRKAAAAKAEILAGSSFYTVTTNRAEIFKEQGKEWETIELGELDEDEDLFKFLASAQAGDISDPLDFDDGIGIVGVLFREMGEAPEGVTSVPQYTLVRCMFNAYEPLDEPDAFEPMRKLLLERKKAAAREALMKEILKGAKIETPYGERLFAGGKKSRVTSKGRKHINRNRAKTKAKVKTQGVGAEKETGDEKHQ